MIRFELNQSVLRGGQRIPVHLVERTLHLVARELRKKKPYFVSLAFLSESQMRQMNAHYRGKNHVTDVLSFPLDPTSGELLFSYEQAKRQAQQMHHPVRDEIVFLLVHGLLHLFGHDHEMTTDAKKMLALQTRLLRKLGVNPQI